MMEGTNSLEDFKLVGWLNVNDRIEYLSLCLMYKIHVKKLLDIYVMLNLSSTHTILRRNSCRTLYQKLSPMDRKRLNIVALNIEIVCLYQYKSQTVWVSFKSKCKKYCMDHFIKEYEKYICQKFNY
jgi:hypothetical protein